MCTYFSVIWGDTQFTPVNITCDQNQSSVVSSQREERDKRAKNSNFVDDKCRYLLFLHNKRRKLELRLMLVSQLTVNTGLLPPQNLLIPVCLEKCTGDRAREIRK
jgi:hypothetical protein